MMFSYDHHNRVDDHYVILMYFFCILIVCMYDKVKACRIHSRNLCIYHTSSSSSTIINITILSTTLYVTYHPISTYHHFSPHLSS